MSNNNNNMNQPLTGGAMDDNLSQASSNSRSRLSGSLLDRIQAQRSREQQQQQGASMAQQGQMIVGPDPTPTQISIPTFNQHPNNNSVPPQPHSTSHRMGASNDFSDLGSASMLSSSGFGGGFAGPQQGGGEEGGLSEALLDDQHRQSDSNYSMSQYFQTFVMDIYGLFRSLPIWAQVILIIFMVLVVIKWI